MNPIFFAYPTKESASFILHRLKENLPLFPISPKQLSLPEIDLPSSGVVISTSGSLGKPKRAHLTYDNLFASFSFSHPDLRLTPLDYYLLSVPLYHILTRCHFSGAKLVFPESQDDSKVTHISFVPTQLKRFLENPKKYPKLKAILVGGAPIPYALCNEAYKKGFPIYITYGMTEMSSQIATEKFCPKKGIAFGLPLPERNLKIVKGEIYVRGKTLFKGYIDLPSPFIDGWFPTKDLGKIGPNGLEILGRKDSMFISGGENIHPEEIQLALLSHPKIERAKVSSRLDDEFGARPVATIQTVLQKEEIREYLQSTLPKFKIPSPNDITLNPIDYNWTK
jgi:O-succinylbenzoic acid--CoA ligase